MKLTVLFLIIVTLGTACTSNQKETSETADYLKMRWKHVATRMPSEWYASDDAKMVAENVLISQKDIGGWAKNKPYHHQLSEGDKAQYIESKGETGATFDNGATITELKFLAKVYSHVKDERFKKAFEKGLDYIFVSQYKNGGWPQFYPVRQGKNVAYSGHITYNDNAMVNTMMFLRGIFSEDKEYSSIEISSSTKAKAKESFEKGIECILNTQIVVDNKPTVWCAQHDAITLAPANARSYELASFSGAESVGILQLLMEIENPDNKIIAAVNGAIEWFETHKIEGIKVETITNKDGKRDRIVVEDKNASPLWGRFSDLETGKPFFCSRDGIKRNTLAEISYNRRSGYSWYTNSPQKVLNIYPEWSKKWNSN